MNNKATVMISTLVGDGVQERIILPEFPYLTDENGGSSSSLMQISKCNAATSSRKTLFFPPS